MSGRRDDGPRRKTAVRMRALLALGAAAGLAASTTRTRADRPAPPADAGADADADGGAPDDSDGGADAMMSDYDHRYEVVDMLPPPAGGCGCRKTPGGS